MSKVTDSVAGLFGGKSKDINIETTPAEDTAQDSADTAQQTTNAAIAKKKSKTLLSTAMSGSDSQANTASTVAVGKKKLGE